MTHAQLANGIPNEEVFCFIGTLKVQYPAFKLISEDGYHTPSLISVGPSAE
jgi:hypothetical protein